MSLSFGITIAPFQAQFLMELSSRIQVRLPAHSGIAALADEIEQAVDCGRRA